MSPDENPSSFSAFVPLVAHQSEWPRLWPESSKLSSSEIGATLSVMLIKSKVRDVVFHSATCSVTPFLTLPFCSLQSNLSDINCINHGQSRDASPSPSALQRPPPPLDDWTTSHPPTPPPLLLGESEQTQQHPSVTNRADDSSGSIRVTSRTLPQGVASKLFQLNSCALQRR